MLTRKLIVMVMSGFFMATTAIAQVDQESLDEFGTGIIEDYGDMQATDDIEWMWIAPGTQLKNHRFEVKPVENLTSFDDSDMTETIDSTLSKTLQRISARNADAEILQVTPAVYWAQRSSTKKMWIPYAGGHLAQAGVGIELVITDSTGKVVATVRHSGREGDKLENAAEELVDELRRFVSSH